MVGGTVLSVLSRSLLHSDASRRSSEPRACTLGNNILPALNQHPHAAQLQATLADYPGSLPSGLPLPDSLAIFVNLTDSVERNPPKPAGFIQKFKSAALTRWKHDLLKWDTVKPAFLSIPIADLKLASAKFLVVTDSAEQFVNRRHSDVQ